MKRFYRQMLRQRPRFIAAMLALLMVVSVFPAMVMAEKADETIPDTAANDTVVVAGADAEAVEQPLVDPLPEAEDTGDGNDGDIDNTEAGEAAPEIIDPNTAAEDSSSDSAEVISDEQAAVSDADKAPETEMVSTTTMLKAAQNDAGATALPEGARLQATMTTEKSSMSFMYTATDTVYVDWGDGNPVEYTSDTSAVVSGTSGTIKVYCGGDINSLSLVDKKLLTLDVTKCNELETLACDSNNLTELDVAHNTALTLLSCSSNNLTELDATHNTALIELRCNNNNLTKLNLANNTALINLHCNNNNLTELDVTHNTTLNSISCNSNNLTELNVTKNTNLGILFCKENQLTFGSLKTRANAGIAIFNYAPQSAVSIPESIPAGGTVDLSSEWNAHGNETVYTWYDSENNTVTPTSSEQGKFTFGESFAGKKLYCKMTNAALPKLTLETTKVAVAIPDTWLQVTMTSERSLMSFEYTATDTVYVDWGDGNPAEYTSKANSTVSGTIKVYCAGDITKLDVGDKGLQSLDVTECSGLKSLFCNNNQLTKLDVSKNIALEELVCSFNKLTELDTSNNTALQYLDCNVNRLTELDVTNNTALVNLICMDNQLRKLDVTKNVLLEGLACAYNQLKELDVSMNTVLGSLSCGDNPLTELDVTKNTALFTLCCWSNQLKELDVSRNPALVELWCYDNQLTELDISNNTSLWELKCDNNQLTFSNIVTSNPIEEVIANLSDYSYAPQDKMGIPAKKAANATIDLSTEWNAHGRETVYTWYDSEDNTVTPTSSEQGKFTFGESFVGKTLYCKMTNAALPELTLTTTVVEITEEEVEPEMSLEVINDANSGAAAELSDDISVNDINGNGYIGKLMLIISNVSGSTKNTVLDAVEACNKEFKASDDNYAMYDISLVDENNKKVEIVDGHVKITLKIPDKLPGEGKDSTLKLYHYDEDTGKPEEVAITLSNGSSYYSFYADDFSPYVLVRTEKKSEGSVKGDSAKTGDNSGFALALAFNVFLLAGFAAYAVAAKRKSRA